MVARSRTRTCSLTTRRICDGLSLSQSKAAFSISFILWTIQHEFSELRLEHTVAKGLCTLWSITPSNNSRRLKVTLHIVAQGIPMVGALDSWGIHRRTARPHQTLLQSRLYELSSLPTHPRVPANSSQKIDSTFSIFGGTTGIYLTIYCLSPVASLEYNGTDYKAYLGLRPRALHGYKS